MILQLSVLHKSSLTSFFVNLLINLLLFFLFPPLLSETTERIVHLFVMFVILGLIN